METGDGWRIAAQRSPGHVPPRWPDPRYPQQAHLDLRVPDLDAGAAKAAELGARRLRENENWYTLADPAGHPFDLCRFPAKQETTIMGVMLDCPDAKASQGSAGRGGPRRGAGGHACPRGEQAWYAGARRSARSCGAGLPVLVVRWEAGWDAVGVRAGYRA